MIYMDEMDAGQRKGDFLAVVASNRRIGDTFWKLRLDFAGEAADAFRTFRPGQFVQLDAAGAPLPPAEQIPEALRDTAERQVMLRRPFSFTDLDVQKRKTVGEILYCVVGPATLRMTMLRPGDGIAVIGPLGNGFWVPEGKRTALLAVGGMGTAPLQHLARHLAYDHKEIEATVFAGARTTRALPFERKQDEISQGLGFALPEFSRYGMESFIATDDGTAGFHGFVTDCVRKWLDENHPKPENTIVYTCGPEVMLAAMAKLAAERRIDCQVSMERRMACGIGVCQSCAVECRVPGTGETMYRMCCKDGPVFDAREVVFGTE